MSTDKIDRTGETLTPEMAQKGEEVKDKTAEEAEKATADAKAKADADAKAEADKKAADDAKKAEDDEKAKADLDKDGKPNEKKRSIYDDLKDKKKEAKEAKSEADVLRSENAVIKAENEALKKLTDKAKKAETPEDQEDLEEDIKEIAKAIGGDPKAIKTLTDFLSKKLLKNNGTPVSKEDLEAIKKFQEEKATSQAEKEFEREWKTFIPSLKTDFPHISDADLESVQKEVHKIAHSKGWNDKDIDYIYFKNKGALSKLISPKRASIESAGNAVADEGTKKVADLSSKSSPMDVQSAVQGDRHSPSGLEIRKSN